MQKNTTVLAIKGMHCRSCEIILEDEISRVRGVKKVRMDFKKGTAHIESDREIDQGAVGRAVEKAGYSVGQEDEKSFFSRNPADYMELAAVASILVVIYLVIKILDVPGFDLNSASTTGLVGVLIVGLTAGVSTCMALIGGLVLGMSSRHAELHPEATAMQKFRPHIYFNIGRLISYALLGGLIGALGSILKLSSSVLGVITVILGFVMLLIGLKLIQIFPRLHNKSLSLPKSLSRLLGLGTQTGEYSHRGSFLTGALTFFVPCGFTQAMQIYAVSTGSFSQGAIIMGTFALGTLPGIIGIGGLTSAVKGTFARYFFKFAGLVVITLAVFNMVTGWNLAGLTLWRNSAPVETKVKAGGGEAVTTSEISGKQVVEMTQTGRGYSPRQFTVKKGIPVVWNIESTNQYSCAAFISMPAAGISQPLEAGTNTIEFTPTKTGKMPFTCSMGMYTGVFNVVE